MDQLFILIEGQLDVLVSRLSTFNLDLDALLQEVDLAEQQLASGLLLLMDYEVVVYGLLDYPVEPLDVVLTLRVNVNQHVFKVIL